MIDLTWSLVKDIAEWVRAAQQAASNKAQRRCVNLVEHAGVLVSGTALLNKQLVALVRPLTEFEPSEWSPERRAVLVTDLLQFSEETTVVPRMRVSREALRVLLVDCPDEDLRAAGDLVLNCVDHLFIVNEQARDNARAEVSETAATGPWALLDAVALDVYGLDYVVRYSLGPLIGSVRSAHDPWEARSVANLARDLLSLYSDDGRQDSLPDLLGPAELPVDWRQGVLAPYAATMQAGLGRMIAASQRSFPTMPTPAWAFS